jgi:hypothetical protein
MKTVRVKHDPYRRAYDRRRAASLDETSVTAQKIDKPRIQQREMHNGR